MRSMYSFGIAVFLLFGNIMSAFSIKKRYLADTAHLSQHEIVLRYVAFCAFIFMSLLLFLLILESIISLKKRTSNKGDKTSENKDHEC